MSIPKEALLSGKEYEGIIPITLQYRGSIAHGMYVPNSDPNSIDDVDIVGCFIAPLDYYFGMRKLRQSKEVKYQQYDCVFYEFKRLIELLMKGNPNVLSMLWVEQKNIIETSWQWRMVCYNREKFLSKQIYHQFVGYARGQMHKMTAYKFEGYMGKKRKYLVDKYGYDCKNAAHMIRLLNMVVEVLTEGVLYVERKSDATFLLDIKKGKYTLDEVKQMADDLFNAAQLAYIKTQLPNKIDIEYLNKRITDILKSTF